MADETEDLTKKETRIRRLADKVALGDAVDRDFLKAERRLEKLGGAGDYTGNALNATKRFALRGAVGSRKAALWENQMTTDANLAEADKVAALARTRAADEIAGTYGSFGPQIQAALGGPMDPNSPSLQAAAARYLAERGTSTTRALSDIDMNLGNMRTQIRNQGREFALPLLTSIGDTVELLRAQAEQDRLANRLSAGAIASNPFSAGASLFGAGRGASMGFGNGMMSNAALLLQAMGGGLGMGAGGAGAGQTMLPYSQMQFNTR